MEGGEGGGEGRGEGREGGEGVVVSNWLKCLAFHVVVGKLHCRKEQNDASFSFIAPSSEE